MNVAIDLIGVACVTVLFLIARKANRGGDRG